MCFYRGGGRSSSKGCAIIRVARYTVVISGHRILVERRALVGGIGTDTGLLDVDGRKSLCNVKNTHTRQLAGEGYVDGSMGGNNQRSE